MKPTSEEYYGITEAKMVHEDKIEFSINTKSTAAQSYTDLNCSSKRSLASRAARGGWFTEERIHEDETKTSSDGVGSTTQIK